MRKRVKPQRNQQSQYRPLRTNETPLFSIPFYTMRWENAPLSQICTDVRKSIKEIEARPNDDGTRRGVQSNEDLETNYTTYFHRDIHQDFIEDTPWYRDLATQLKDTYIDILFHRFNKPVDYISRENVHLFLWVNLYTKEHLHMYHNHKGSVLSGTFYVETSPPCAPIVFVIQQNHIILYSCLMTVIWKMVREDIVVYLQYKQNFNINQIMGTYVCGPVISIIQCLDVLIKMNV